MSRPRRHHRPPCVPALGLCAALAASACRDPSKALLDAATPAAPAAAANPAPALPRTTLRVAGFSAAREVVQTRLLPPFADGWRRSKSQLLELRTHFAGSEALLGSLSSTFPADLALLGSPRDANALVAAGLVDGDWNTAPYGGIACQSLVVLAVRKGNPKGIRNWADLARPGIQIVAPDATRSSGGLWDVCAIYGAALRGHAGVPTNDAEAAHDFLARVSANVVARADSASESFRSFLQGLGDVAITYENEIALARMFGYEEERVVPSSTLLVECPVVVLGGNADAHGTRDAATALRSFLFTPEAQRQFATCGVRPVDPAIANARRAEFPLPQDLWTIDFLGGWSRLAEHGIDGEPKATPAPAPSTGR